MKVKVVLEFEMDAELADQIDVPGKVRQLCRDAFREFRNSRQNAEGYVEKRYAGQTQRWLDKKVCEVRGRRDLAHVLKLAVSDSIIEVDK